jgi:hypothetical protein
MTAVTITTSQFTVIASNSARKGLIVYNQSPVNVHVSSVTGFTLGNEPLVINPNQRWILPVAYTGALYGRGDQAHGQLLVTEV